MTSARSGRRLRQRAGRAAAVVVLLVGVVGAGCGEAGGDGAELAEPRELSRPADVAALVDGRLTPEGERLLYGARPRILPKAEFDVACPHDSEVTVVLDCFIDGSIAILRVDQPGLSRIMEVTAAHEMLHAAYLVLSRPDRERVDGWIGELSTTLDDPQLRDVLDRYERLGPRRHLNELHSILGTEMPVLSPALETYYQRYFVDRQRVVEAHQSYAAVFQDLKRRVDELHAELAGLKARLDSLDSRIAQKRAELDGLNSRLEQLRARGDLRTYNSLIPEQNALVDEYTGLIDQFNEVVALHNQKVDEVNGLALEQDELTTSLGAKPSVIPERS